jgi:hypothetical protein
MLGEDHQMKKKAKSVRYLGEMRRNPAHNTVLAARTMRRRIAIGVVALASVGAGVLGPFVLSAGATTYEPENTIFGISYQGCSAYAEYGNYGSAAYSKMANGSCEGSTGVEGYNSGNYSFGGYAFSYPNSGWAQSTVANASLVGAYFDECTLSYCPNPTFYSPL